MRELSKDETGKLSWDEPIPAETREKFVQILGEMEQLKDVTFPRCVVPVNADPDHKPQLLCFSDGSTSAFCSLIYGRWRLVGGGYSCCLIAGKARVAPLRKISVPRLELLGAVASVRLASQVQEFLGLEFEKRHFFTDSSAVLGMIRAESTVFNEFVGNRVAEIKTKSEPAEEWSWLPTEQNLADLGTRETVLPQDMMQGSPYQCGLSWMKLLQADCQGTDPPSDSQLRLCGKPKFSWWLRLNSRSE
jgi:hypothetical protein